MKKTIFLSIIFIMLSQALSAARPTLHASNLSITNITCHSMQLNWTNGNGNARLIFGREGSPTNYAPVDRVIYLANPHFGHASQYAGGNYCVYNAQGSNYVVIDSLKTGKTYYFTIFEHDNNGANTLYYTAGAPSVFDSTYYLNLSFTLKAFDSCETHNLFQFTNTSISSIPGVSYTFDFGDTYSSTLNTVSHQYNNKNGAITTMLTASQNSGCLNYLTKTIRVYPKKVVTFDFTNFKDTQCLNGNYFVLNPVPLSTPLPKSIVYIWKFGDGTTSTFKKMVKSYKKSGHYKVELETDIFVNLTPSGCKDTLRLELEVLPAPAPFLGNDTLIYSNEKLSLDAGSALRYLWNTSDTNRSILIDGKTAPKGKNWYSVNAFNALGCMGNDSIAVTVDNNSFTGQKKHDLITVYPNPVTGILQISNLASINFEWTVFNLAGEKVLVGNYLDLFPDFTDQSPGIYILEIKDGSGSRNVKLVKI